METTIQNIPFEQLLAIVKQLPMSQKRTLEGLLRSDVSMNPTYLKPTEWRRACLDMVDSLFEQHG
jgi:hypothetical protein